MDACFAKQILQGRVIYHRKKRTLKMKPRGLCFKKRILKSAFLGFIFWVRFMRSSEVTKLKPLKTNPLKPTLCSKHDRFPIPNFAAQSFPLKFPHSYLWPISFFFSFAGRPDHILSLRQKRFWYLQKFDANIFPCDPITDMIKQICRNQVAFKSDSSF